MAVETEPLLLRRAVGANGSDRRRREQPLLEGAVTGGVTPRRPIAVTGPAAEVVRRGVPGRGVDERSRDAVRERRQHSGGAVGVVARDAERRQLRGLGRARGRIARQDDRRPPVDVLQPHGALGVLALVVADLAVAVRDRVRWWRDLHVVTAPRELADDGAAAALDRVVAAGARSAPRESGRVLVAGGAIGLGVVLAHATVVPVLRRQGVADLAHTVVGGVTIGEGMEPGARREDHGTGAGIGRRHRRLDQREIAIRLSLVVVTVPAARRLAVLGTVVDHLPLGDGHEHAVPVNLGGSAERVAGETHRLGGGVVAELRVARPVQVVAEAAVVLGGLAGGRRGPRERGAEPECGHEHGEPLHGAAAPRNTSTLPVRVLATKRSPLRPTTTSIGRRSSTGPTPLPPSIAAWASVGRSNTSTPASTASATNTRPPAVAIPWGRENPPVQPSGPQRPRPEISARYRPS